jgi:hypothetical protein
MWRRLIKSSKRRIAQNADEMHVLRRESKAAAINSHVFSARRPLYRASNSFAQALRKVPDKINFPLKEKPTWHYRCTQLPRQLSKKCSAI